MKLLRKIKVEPNLVVGNKIMLPHVFLYSFISNFFLLAFVFTICLAIILLREDFLEKQVGNFKNGFYGYTSEVGFVVEDVIVEGREKSTKEEILKALDVKRGDNILRYDIWKAKEKLESLPWVKNATVRRSFFPNIIYVSIKEKQVLAIWQRNEKFYPIDEEGNVVDSTYIPQGINLLIVGEKAPENLKNLLLVIGIDEEIGSRIKVANFVSGRRWNLILDDLKQGITIKLPEENMEKAWKKLLKLNATDGLLKRKLTFIDLRLPDKVVVKLEKDGTGDGIKQKKERKI